MRPPQWLRLLEIEDAASEDSGCDGEWRPDGKLSSRRVGLMRVD